MSSIFLMEGTPLPLWSSVYECQRVECAFTSPVRTECVYDRDVLYAVLYVGVSCFVVRGCGVSRRYIYMIAIVICLVLLMCTMTI